VSQIAASIKEFGFTNPLLIDEQGGIIAGHGRLMAAKKLGLQEVPTITLGGLTEAQKKAYVIADNQLALNAGWDMDTLRVEIEHLKEVDFDIDLLGFGKDQLNEILSLKDAISPSPYSQKVGAPTYEPTGEKPSLEELFSDEKAMDLITTIQASKLEEKEKQFLMAAASRHIVFNYEKIANFYAHSTKECQELMECSALVIIDFDKAIANGFVQLAKEMDDILSDDDDE
jgi:hypothetical protein